MSRRDRAQDRAFSAMDELLGIAGYEVAEGGCCGDCGRDVRRRHVVGQVRVCAACCRRRMLAAVDMSTESRYADADAD